MADSITAQELMDKIQKNLSVPWQSQRADGFGDGIHLGDPDTSVTGIVTTFTPTLDVLKRTVASGWNTVICRETPFYSRGERAPLFWRNGAEPPKALTESDAVCQAKRDFILQNRLVIIHFFDNWEARKADGQLRGLALALGWDKFHSQRKDSSERYRPGDAYFVLPPASLNGLARSIQAKLKVHGMRVIGDPQSRVSKIAVVHGLLLVADLEQISKKSGVDVVVAGDAVEWEAGPYFQDLVTAEQAKGLILVGDEVSEEPGSGEVTEWLKGFVNEVPVEWIRAGEPFWTLSDPLYQYKVNFLEKDGMVVWRLHDHRHARRPDGIFAGWNRAMGWENYLDSGGNAFSHDYVVPETTFEQLARELQSKLKVRSMRLVGDPQLRVTRVGNGGHYISQCMGVLPKVDVLIVFESREWEAAEYVRDAVAAGEKKALIQLPHEGGEEAGMDECARWLRSFVSEVPVEFIPSGDPFWMPA